MSTQLSILYTTSQSCTLAPSVSTTTAAESSHAVECSACSAVAVGGGGGGDDDGTRYGDCAKCGRRFAKTGNNHKRCHECRPQHKLEYNRERAQQLGEDLLAQQKAWRDGPGAEWLKKYRRDRYLADPEGFKEASRRWREQNPEAFDAWSRNYYLVNEAEIAEKNRVRKYGLSTEVLRAIYDAQAGACAICRRGMTFRRCCVDHDHDTGEVRGILCHGCNLGLGLAGAA